MLNYICLAIESVFGLVSIGSPEKAEILKFVIADVSNTPEREGELIGYYNMIDEFQNPLKKELLDFFRDKSNNFSLALHIYHAFNSNQNAAAVIRCIKDYDDACTAFKKLKGEWKRKALKKLVALGE